VCGGKGYGRCPAGHRRENCSPEAVVRSFVAAVSLCGSCPNRHDYHSDDVQNLLFSACQWYSRFQDHRPRSLHPIYLPCVTDITGHPWHKYAFSLTAFHASPVDETHVHAKIDVSAVGTEHFCEGDDHYGYRYRAEEAHAEGTAELDLVRFDDGWYIEGIRLNGGEWYPRAWS